MIEECQDRTLTWEKDGVEIQMDILLPEMICVYSHQVENTRYVIGSIGFREDTEKIAEYTAKLFDELPAIMRESAV